jgi:ABC-2 type transport system permease protein
MGAFTLLLKTYLKFYVSTRRFLVIVPIYLFLALIFPALVLAGVISNAPDVYAYTQLALGNFSFATALVAGLLAGDALSQDFSRQGLFTLTQPIRRSVIMLARFGSATIASVIVVVLAFLLPGFIFSEVFFQSIVPSTPEILGLSLVFIASMVAFVVLFSSLFKSPTISIVLALVLVWIVMPTISSLLPLVSIEPWFFISYAGGAIVDVAAKTYPQHVQRLSAGGFGPGGGAGGGSGLTFTTYNPTIPEALAIMLAYLLVSLALAWIVYSRRELKDVS